MGILNPSLEMSPQELAKIHQRQKAATSYAEWLEAAKELDTRLGYNRWKSTRQSQLYDYELVEQRLNELKEARESNNPHKLLYLIRTTFSRNVGNMGDPDLFMRSYSGTKDLIEEYLLECERSVEALLGWGTVLNDTYLINTLVQTRKSFGRTALVLSGGATLGLMHAGVLYELHKNNLLPKIISGSSAGSIFASLVCIHGDDEIDSLWSILEMPLDIFERTGQEETFMTRLKRFLKEGTWIDSEYLREMMQGLLGDTTFQEAYNRTGKILNVTVSAAGNHDMPRLLNYLTAPNVLIWSAVCASCSVPLVFASNVLMAKTPDTGEIYSWSKATFIDGSVDNDLPLDRLAEMFNVNHFIACQVNPHIAPLLHLSERLGGSVPLASSVLKSKLNPSIYTEDVLSNDCYKGSTWWNIGKSVVLNELTHALSLLDQVGLMQSITGKLSKLMAQEYIGNITILPRIEISDFRNLLQNPTPEITRSAMQRGREATWPKLAIVRNHLTIELTLDRAIHRLRTRLIGQHPLHLEAPVKSNRNHQRRMSEEVLLKSRRWQSSSDLNNYLHQGSRSPQRSPQGSNVHLPSLRTNSVVEYTSKTTQNSPAYTKNRQQQQQQQRLYKMNSLPTSRSANVSPIVSRSNSHKELPALNRHNSIPGHFPMAGNINGSASSASSQSKESNGSAVAYMD